jgi:DNA polymerase-4/DNA polymerase V
MKRTKAILHIDGDAFFVGVEVAKNPKLKGLPVVTGQERGIVSALSYEAKALGITRGMPIFRVNKEFPSVIVLPGDYKEYVRYSEMMFEIVKRYAQDVEEYSIDECFADLTGFDIPYKMSYKEIAEKIKKDVNGELNLSVSLGVAPTKVLAKIASNWQKPNGLTVIEKNEIDEFTKKTQIDRIWGIGPKTSAKLSNLKINTAKDFTDKSIEWIREHCSKPYESIWHELKGESILHIDSERKTKYSSIQKTRSFHPATNDEGFLLSQISKHVEESCAKARHYKLFPKEISIFLKTKEFKYKTTSFTMDTPTNAPEQIIAICRKEFKNIYNPGVLYRTAGVTLRKLVPTTSIQNDLFGSTKQVDKFEFLHNHIDLLEKKHNKKLIYLGTTHKAISNKKEGTDSDDLDKDLLFL